MNTQPEIKSHCQELLKEQETSRRKIRELISKVIDLTRCLEAYGWTLNYGNCDEGQWFKVFSLPYPLQVKRYRQSYLKQKITVRLYFSKYYVNLWVESYPEFGAVEYYLYSYYVIPSPRIKWKILFIFQNFADELSKIIASAETELFYDKTKQKQIEVIPVSELRTKIKQVFEEICKKFIAES